MGKVLLFSTNNNGLLEKILSLSTVMKQLDDHISSRFGGYKALYAKDFVIYGS